MGKRKRRPPRWTLSDLLAAAHLVLNAFRLWLNNRDDW